MKETTTKKLGHFNRVFLIGRVENINHTDNDEDKKTKKFTTIAMSLESFNDRVCYIPIKVRGDCEYFDAMIKLGDTISVSGCIFTKQLNKNIWGIFILADEVKLICKNKTPYTATVEDDFSKNMFCFDINKYLHERAGRNILMKGISKK